MKQLNAIFDGAVGAEEIPDRYRDNFARHTMGVALYLQSEIMHTLTRQRGHRDLRISYAPYLTIIGDKGARLSDIAGQLGISRQAANQTANQIETAGYIARRADARDGRAKLLVTTGRGKQLRKDGAAVAARLQEELCRIVSKAEIRDATASLMCLSRRLNLLLPDAADTPPEKDLLLAALLPGLREYINDRLMKLTIARGHPDLKHSFGQVLTAIGPRGGRIQQMAASQGVSKQAISAVASELEKIGYIHRVVDTSDARQVVLLFTRRGRDLIADSVTSVDELQREFSEVIGREAMERLSEVMCSLYRALHLEEEVFGNTAPADIRLLARQLTQQLGEEGARALGQILLSCAAT